MAFKKEAGGLQKEALFICKILEKINVLQCAERVKRKRLSRKSFWKYFQSINYTQKALKDVGIHIKNVPSPSILNSFPLKSTGDRICFIERFKVAILT